MVEWSKSILLRLRNSTQDMCRGSKYGSKIYVKMDLKSKSQEKRWLRWRRTFKNSCVYDFFNTMTYFKQYVLLGIHERHTNCPPDNWSQKKNQIETPAGRIPGVFASLLPWNQDLHFYCQHLSWLCEALLRKHTQGKQARRRNSILQGQNQSH